MPDYRNELLDALDAVTWYNGLAVKILEWKNQAARPSSSPASSP